MLRGQVATPTLFGLHCSHAGRMCRLRASRAGELAYLRKGNLSSSPAQPP